MLIDWCIFILLSRESDGALCFGRIRTRLGVDHFPSFPVDVLTSSHVNLLLVRSHQAEIIIVKRLIQGRNNVTRVWVELMICDQSRRKNDAFTHSATLLLFVHALAEFCDHINSKLDHKQVLRDRNKLKRIMTVIPWGPQRVFTPIF